MSKYTTIPVFIDVEGGPAEAYAKLHAALWGLAGPLTPGILGWGSFDPGDRAKWTVSPNGIENVALTLDEVIDARTFALVNLIPED